MLNDRKIAAAILNRDEEMLAYVVRKYSKLLWKVAGAVLINAASAQDVEECVADVFIYLWQHPEKYEPDRAGLSTWLSLVARSKAIDRYRQLMRNQEFPMEEMVAESLEQAWKPAADGEKEEILSRIEGLGEREKELILRRYYYEQKPAEIAAALGMSKKQVENKLYYVRQKLRKRMEGEEGGQAYGKI